jgi:hypothetical protein
MDRFLEWREVLQLAPNLKAVNAIMQDYVKEFGPVLEALPKECRDALRGDIDVQAAAVALLQAELRFKGSDEQRAVLHEIAHTFASAAVRVTLLYPRPATVASAG